MVALIRRGKFIHITEDEMELENVESDEMPVKVFSTIIIAVETRNSRSSVLKTCPMLRAIIYMEDSKYNSPLSISINNKHLISEKIYAQKMFDQFYQYCQGKFIMIGDMDIIPYQMVEQYRYNLYVPRLLIQKEVTS